ncbi:hypothetical protein ACQKWADRAFT_305253 [Trichoderma austrokoningii]
MPAAFHSDDQLENSPSVASSDIAVTPTIKISSNLKPAKKPRKSLLSASSIPKPSFRTVPAATLVQDENIPPAPDGFLHPDPPNQRLASKLPKSRTMSALHDLKASISRPKLAIRSINTSAFTGSSPKSSPSSAGTDATLSNPSNLNLVQPPTASPANSDPSSSPGAPFMRISTAQSSAYWSGRFVALHDKYSSEHLAKEAIESRQSLTNSFSARPKTPYSTLHQRASHLPNSTTTSALRSFMTSSNVTPENEEDARCRRVFDHLDSLCATDDARHSLHVWQQAYARRHGRPSLLPEGGVMEERGLMAKIFRSSGAKKSERLSLTRLRHGSYNHDNKTKSFLSGSLSRSSREKRLTLS